MKLLPQGTWITLNNVVLGTTEEDVLAFLSEAGVDLEEKCVVVNEHQTRAQVIICLRHNEITELLQRAILDKPLNGSVPTLVYRERKNHANS